MSVLNPKVVVGLVFELVLVEEHNVENVQEHQADWEDRHLVPHDGSPVDFVDCALVGVAEHPGHEAGHEDQPQGHSLSVIIHCLMIENYLL